MSAADKPAYAQEALERTFHRKKLDPPLVEPTWEQIHADLDAGKQIGTYGACHSAYHGLAGLRAGVDLNNVHGKRSPDEFYSPELSEHMEHPATRAEWNKIFTFDPLGMYAKIPTMSWTKACISFPEIKDALVADGKIVDGRDMSINVTKVAMDYVWNLPRFAEGIGIPENKVREALHAYTQNENVLDTKRNAYLPPVGGATAYIIGDVRKIHDPSAEIAVRVHDQCTGSDAMGTDICTCRPYLVYAAQACAEIAQRGGVGVLIYYQKEGRSLGEVTKFRVYNARKRQEGGDRPEMYFHHTEQIAGIRDARFQEMMPDALLWLGISRIDWLMSMSSEKYDAITSAGIRVMQRVALPDVWVPKNAGVEITAKVASGYHSGEMDVDDNIESLRHLKMVRTRCNEIFQLAEDGKTRHFALHLDKLDACADYVVQTIQERYPDLDVPAHSRWRHFNAADIKTMVAQWPSSSATEIARRKIDLITVSVLLDAGAGAEWKYHSHKGGVLNRSEGLALASLEMFQEGLFSSDVAVPNRVNSHGLKAMTLAQLTKGLQVNESNPLVGVQGRYELLQALANAMTASPKYFGEEVHRPGNIVDYVLSKVVDGRVSLNVLWECIVVGLEPIWPSRHQQRGDVWVYTDLKRTGVPCSDFVPFHKLSQWLAYSMLEVFTEIGVAFDDLHLMTGLSEYRNGGLFVDTGVLSPKNPLTLEKQFSTGSELIVEWRALTVILLDRVADIVRTKLNKTVEELPLASVLEGGTWQAGRNIAKTKRQDGSPPINVLLIGTVF
jgi:GTP cyclohydrolase II